MYTRLGFSVRVSRVLYVPTCIQLFPHARTYTIQVVEHEPNFSKFYPLTISFLVSQFCTLESSLCLSSSDYYLLYHDCSDLSHVLVFTITWQKRNQVISWYKTNIDCSIFGGWLNLLPLGVLETVTIFPWAFGPRENSSGLQST